MPRGYMPVLPPPPDQLPFSPYAGQMGQMPQGLTPPPSAVIRSGTPGQDAMQQAGREKFNPLALLPALAGLGMGVFGKGGVSNFGAGFAQGSSGALMQQNLENRRREAEQEEYTIKNVHAQMEKIRRLGDDPRYQEIIGQYDQAMMDNKLTAKEAARLHQQAMGLGDIERSLKAKDNEDARREFQARAEIEQRLKTAGNVKQMVGGQEVSLTPDQYADYTVSKERIASSDAATDKRAAAMEAAATRRMHMEQNREDARQARFETSQRGVEERFGSRQDVTFQNKMDHWFGAQEALKYIDDSLNRFQSTNAVFHPIDKTLAGNELNTSVKALSALVGRNIGERGPFTEGDRQTYSSILSPGLVIAELAPEEAIRRLNKIKELMASIKQREIGAYTAVNPTSKLLEYYRTTEAQNPTLPSGLTPMPPAGEAPPGLNRRKINGVEYEKRDGPQGRGWYKVRTK